MLTICYLYEIRGDLSDSDPNYWAINIADLDILTKNLYNTHATEAALGYGASEDWANEIGKMAESIDPMKALNTTSTGIKKIYDKIEPKVLEVTGAKPSNNKFSGNNGTSITDNEF